MQTPSVGRIVHYVRMATSNHEAALITDVIDVGRGAVSLIRFPPGPHIGAAEGFVLYDARLSPGTWHYPEHIGTVQWHESEEIPAPRTAGE